MNDKIIDTTKVWLDVKTVADLKGITERAVRLAIMQQKYIAKTHDIRGGKRYKICLSSLEPELQSKYLNEYYKALVFEETENLPEVAQPVQERIIPENMKRIALARMDLLNLWQEYKKVKKNKQEASKEFLNLYNTGEFYKEIFEVLKTTSIGSPWRLKTIYRTNIQTSYMAGRYKIQAENTDNRPYWQYVAVMDKRTRASHARLNGRIFIYDDPFWNDFYPPNGWGCRCRIRALSNDNLKDRNLGVDSAKGQLSEEMKVVSKKPENLNPLRFI